MTQPPLLPEQQLAAGGSSSGMATPESPAEPTPSAPAPATSGISPDGVNIRLTNRCQAAGVVAALYYQRPNGAWKAAGWFELAPGQSMAAARTINDVYYVHAHRQGDEACTQVCVWEVLVLGVGSVRSPHLSQTVV
jgi:hypothetical protein